MRKYISKSTKPLSVLLVFILTAFVAHAQNVVTGKVTDLKGGYGIQGVTVNVKGTQRSTQTDANGNFSITVSPTSPLVFTSTGYATKEVAAVILRSITEASPEHRYLVGNDAVELINARKSNTDEEFEKIIVGNLLK